MIQNVGLDASTFLRFLRLLRNSFTCVTVIGIALLIVNIIYNVKHVSADNRRGLSLLTIQNVSGSWMWPAVGASYIINFIIMFFSEYDCVGPGHEQPEP